ncbi:MAG: NAD(P)/FAD-dependent oxidoreductase [Caldilineaceae bacterium]
MTQILDTLIIGAGAAGLAAGRKLFDAGQSILIVEARPRIGGRIWTDDAFADFPIDLGAEFIHGEGAVTHELVAAAGFHTLDAPRKKKLQIGVDGALRTIAQLPPALAATVQALFAAYDELAQHDWTARDQSLADYLRGRGFDAGAIGLADVLLAQTCCASIERLSCADLAREMRVDHAGLQEFHIREGYTALLQYYGHDLPIRLNTPVELIRWWADGVEVVANGEVLRAARGIITLPIGVLQSGTVHFEPPLPPAKAHSIAAFRMEPGTKLIYRFAAQLWDDDLVYACHTGLAARWWTPGYGRANAHVLCCFVTAERARQIDAMPEAEALALGLAEIGPLLGQPDLAAACVQAKRICWAHEPFTGGAYAHIPPGAADARVQLAQPVDNVLYFAGEATAHETNPQTVHGAIESGWRAARAVMEASLE